MFQELILAVELYLHNGVGFVATVHGKRKLITLVDTGKASGTLGGVTLSECLELASAILAGANAQEVFRIGSEQLEVTIQDEETVAPPAPPAA